MPDMSSSNGHQETGTLIAQGVRVEGDFASQGDVTIEGEVHGKVSITGMLTVGPHAKLKADVSSTQAVIAGNVEGNVTVSGHMNLKSTAKIVGDVSCETAEVESGAVLNGKVAIGATTHGKASKPQEAKEGKA